MNDNGIDEDLPEGIWIILLLFKNNNLILQTVLWTNLETMT